MGCLCTENKENKQAQANSTDNFPKVYFRKDKREYMLKCAYNEPMKSVVRRFCQQYSLKKIIFTLFIIIINLMRNQHMIS